MQVESTKKNVVGGTGLGLSISKGIAKQMGGTIDAESTLGVGSTFTFSVVLQKAEDDTVGRLLIQRLADTRGWHVYFAENGEDVLKTLPKLDVNIILMDVQMPLLDGFEATTAIREGKVEGKENIPIIAMTAFALDGDKEKCLSFGMNDYVSKPLVYSDLIQKVEHWNNQVTNCDLNYSS